MKQFFLVGFLVLGLCEGTYASHTADGTMPDVTTNRDVGRAFFHERETSCPALTANDSVVTMAVAPDLATDLKPFQVRLNGALWQVSRDLRETTLTAVARGNLPTLVFRGDQGGNCDYLYTNMMQFGRMSFAYVKAVLLKKVGA